MIDRLSTFMAALTLGLWAMVCLICLAVRRLSGLSPEDGR